MFSGAPVVCQESVDIDCRTGWTGGFVLGGQAGFESGATGFDVLTYATVRTSVVPPLGLPNIRPVENREQAAVTTRRAGLNGDLTLAVSLGMPSMEPEVWRRDVHRARERIGKGQMLIVSVLGTTASKDREALIVSSRGTGSNASRSTSRSNR